MSDSSSEIQSEEARLAKYMAAGTHVITGYDEAVEVMRHVKMRTETLDETRTPFLADTVHDLHGSEHVVRRRVMNRLVRPDALERYREEITMHTLLRRLRRLAETPDPDGNHRVDLLKFSKLVFVQFAAAIIGLESSTEDAAIDLEKLVDGIDRAIHAKFMYGEAASLVADGLVAKHTFHERYLSPALARCPVDHAGKASVSTPSLVALFVDAADPAWGDADLSVRESISFVIAALETSSALITSSVDELHRWLLAHPEDRDLTGDLAFLALVVQEALRLRPPSLPFFERQAAEDIVLSTTGRVIKKDEFLAVIMRAANLDTRVFGADANQFNPRRQLPPAVPRYGISFGAGQHQCLGLRVVLGNDGVGSQAYVLKTYIEAGVIPDPDRRPAPEPSDRHRFRTYPVVFTNLKAVVK